MNIQTFIKYSLTLILALNQIISVAQVTINVTMIPPFSPDLFTYTDDADKILITITNNNAGVEQIKLAGTFRSLDDAIVIATSPSYQPPLPLVLNSGQTVFLTSAELGDLFPNESSIDVTGISRDQLVRTRRLPANSYQLCVQAFDYNSRGHSIPLSSSMPIGCSNVFTIQTLNPPDIMSIGTQGCEGVMPSADVDNFLIQWIAPPMAPISTKYIVEIVDMIPTSRQPLDAFESATLPIFFTDSVVTVSSYLYTADKPKLQDGHKYAVRVRAVDRRGNTLFANKGYSEPCTFFYGSSSMGGTITLRAAYPNNGDYVPFNYAPTIVQFAPYDVDIYRFTYSNAISINGSALTTISGENRWPHGPIIGQSISTDLPISEEESTYLAVNESDDVSFLFEKGGRYAYDVEGAFLHRDRVQSNPYRASCRGEFIAGMGVPLNKLPEHNSTVDSGDIELIFSTAEQPANPLPPFDIVRGGTSASPEASFFNGTINDAYKLEISRTIDFVEIVETISRPFNPQVNLEECIENSSLLTDSVYRNINHTVNLTDTGDYYWRVSWMGIDPAEDASAYITGSVFRFRIGSDSDTTTTDTLRETPPECNANVIAEAPTNIVPVSTAVVGNNIQVGLFTMELTEINWTGVSAVGKGVINVPMMNAPLKVAFTGVRINSGLQLIQGTVKGVVDNTSILPEELSNQGGGSLAVTESTAESIDDLVNTGTRLASQMVGTAPIGLPIGLDNVIDGHRYTIGVVGLKFTKEKATLNAMIRLGLPDLNGFLSLGASDIAFHPNGINDGEGSLYLPIDRTLDFSDDTELVIKAQTGADSGTYVSWDCQGFKELAIKGEINFSREILVPDSENGDAGPGIVTARFKTKVRRMGNWFCSLDIDAFQTAEAPGWGFEAQEAFLDFSDAVNAGSLSFPEGYAGDTTEIWKGFYLKRVAVRFPKEFESFGDPETRLTAAVTNLMIDRTGFSADLVVENLLGISEGNLDGWGYSLDSVYISILSNNFRSAGFNGEVKLPISENDKLRYDASLNRSSAGYFDFEFLIQPKDTLNIDIWKGTLDLFPTSLVGVTVDTGGFAARADLSGHISFIGDLGDAGGVGTALQGVSMRGIEFQNLTINSRGPTHLDCGHFAFASEQHESGGFPLSIRDISIVNRAGPGLMEFDQSPGIRVGIQFTVDLSLTGESNAFRASTQLAFLGKLNLGNEEAQVWTFSGVNLDSIAISGKVGVVELEGSLVFYNSDPTYGKGIKGYIKAGFDPTIEVEATVQFGNVNGYRYWYVDALATWSPGVTLFPGLDLRGIGGGAWYHMKKPTPIPYSSIVGSSIPASESAGSTSTGLSYVPDGNIGLGFEARLKVGATGNSSAYHGLIALGAQFTSAGSIERLYLEGDFIIMSQTDERNDAVASADFLVDYNFVENKFLANFNVYVNVYGVLKGANENNLAGAMEILVSPDDWHIFVGKPETPISLSITIADVELQRTGFYFMAGLSLPAMPDLPAELASLNVSNTRSHLISGGDGFALGSFLRFDLDFRMTPFYMDVNFGLGFDVSVLKQVEGSPCEGADGWYANGQIYAFFDASVGLYVDIWIYEGEIEIFGGGAAAYLRGGFPNPNWAEGAVAANYSVLGGIVSGSFHYDFVAGTKCENTVAPPGNPLAGMEIVSDLFPSNGSRNIDCGIEPSALYQYPLGEEFSLTQLDHEGNRIVRTFRVERSLTKLLKNNTVPEIGDLRQEQNDELVVFSALEFLEARTAYKWTTTAVAKEKINGRWVTSRTDDDEELKKEYFSNFITGDRPDEIRDQDVAFTYPFRDQRFFLQGECDKGVVALERRMSYLFEQENSNPDYIWTYKAKFIPMDGSAPILVDLTGTSTNYIGFTIPTLKNNMVYRLDLVAIRKLTDLARTFSSVMATIGSENSNRMQRVLSLRETSLRTTVGNSNVVVRQKTIIGDPHHRSDNYITLYNYFFKTSEHNTIASKIAAKSGVTSTNNHFGLFEQFTVKLEGTEGFDDFDIHSRDVTVHGHTYSINSLVNLGSRWTTSNNFWMRENNFHIYQFFNYMKQRNMVSSRARIGDRRYGVPPKGPVKFSTAYNPISRLSESEKNPMSISSSIVGSSVTTHHSSYAGTGGYSAISYGAITPSVSFVPIIYATPITVFLHGQNVRNFALNYLSTSGGINSEFLTSQSRQYFRSVLYPRYNYRPAYNSGINPYKIKVTYKPPHCSTLDTDASFTEFSFTQ